MGAVLILYFISNSRAPVGWDSAVFGTRLPASHESHVGCNQGPVSLEQYPYSALSCLLLIRGRGVRFTDLSQAIPCLWG